MDEADLLRAYPSLQAEDLTHAWAYARAHRWEIEQQIRKHEAALEPPRPVRPSECC